MDPDLMLELLELAKKNIEIGIEAIELVALNDGTRGTFYGTRTAEYMRDALKEPNGLDGYISDVELEKDKSIRVELSWEGIDLEEDYVRLPVGEKLRFGDHIYRKDQWETFEQAYGEKGTLLIGMTYHGDRFRASRSKTEFEKTRLPTPPEGWRPLVRGEKIRWNDMAYNVKGTWSVFSDIRATSGDLVGTPYDPTSLKMVVRRKEAKQLGSGVRPSPLPDFRELVSNEPIKATDLVYVNYVWMMPTSSTVINQEGNIVGLLYDPVKYLVIRRIVELVQPPMI